ncbi:MAG TPA: hypothetical protein VMT30_00560 [Candidatus Saccharimonadia bacterium]|nr:hypothetical protein [Candidatus Saccharimonadia bacterium]
MIRLALGLLYLILFIIQAVFSYSFSDYNFHSSPLLFVLGGLGALMTAVWWRRLPARLDWLLVAALLVVAVATFPGTSRDHLRYLFDGEMIRIWHLSPYVHLPYEVPVDQYSQPFAHIWWTRIPSPYGPLWEAMMVGVNFISNNRLVGGLIALKLLNLAGLLACAWYLYRLTGRKSVAYVLLINPVVLADTVATPHTDIVMAAFLLMAGYYQRAPVRGLLTAAAVLIKPHMIIFWPFLAKSWRQGVVVGVWVTVALVGLLLALKPLVGFDWLPMVQAAQGGGVTARISLLMYGLFPWAPAQYIYLASYGLFFAGYAGIFWLYVRHRVSSWEALALASLLVPLCLTGVLLPWHFMLPITLLLLSDKRIAKMGVLFFTFLVMRSAVSVLELLITAVVVMMGYLIVREVYHRLSEPRGLLLWAVEGLRS